MEEKVQRNQCGVYYPNPPGVMSRVVQDLQPSDAPVTQKQGESQNKALLLFKAELNQRGLPEINRRFAVVEESALALGSANVF